MKQFYTLFIGFVIGTATLAQTCVPNTSLTSPGFYPPPGGSMRDDTILVMPTAYWTTPYSEVIQFVIPADTTIVYNNIPFTVPIDSMKLLNAYNLPAGLSYACDNSGCVWQGGDNGCMSVFGNVNSTSVGTYLAYAEVEGYVTISGFGAFSDTFNLYIEFGVEEHIGIEEAQWSDLRVSPNPMTTSTNFEFSLNSGNQQVLLEIIDVTGRVVYRKNTVGNAGVNTIEVRRDGWPEGLYLYRFSIGENQHAGRLFIHDGI